MACFHPLTAWRGDISSSGKREIVFSKPLRSKLAPQEISLPCGQCVGCRLERSRQWAMRCLHEASLYKENCFLTLTYDDEHLPVDRSLVKSDFQKFIKRLRKNTGRKIRYFMCGEYGEEGHRPHYHACLFGFDFDDKIIFKDGTVKLFVSDTLNKVWQKGYCIIGEVTFESAAYIARYILKKQESEKKALRTMINFFKAGATLEQLEKLDSQLFNVSVPVYNNMSRRPGVGREYFEKYKADVYPSDFMVVDGRKMKPPKYYDSLLEEEELKDVKDRRIEKVVHEVSYFERLCGIPDRIRDGSPERLAVKEFCVEEKVRRAKKRDF